MNQATAQLNSLFRSMTLGARITAGLLLVVIVVSLAYLFNGRVSGPDSYLMGAEPISGPELNAMQAAFGKANLKGYVIEGNRIRVPRGEESVYMAALADGGAMPANFNNYLEDALEKGGPFASKSKTLEQLKIAKQRMLANIINGMQGIDSATVMFDSADENGMSGRKIYTASVHVVTEGGVSLENSRVQAIRELVAGSYAGMSPQNVTLTDQTGFVSRPTRPEDLTNGNMDMFTQAKLSHEEAFIKNIRDALAYVPGALVSCNVELNTEVERIERKSHHDPKTVPFSVIEESKTLSSQGPGPGGRPGMAQQGGTNQPAVIANTGGSRTEEEQSTRQEQNKVGGRSEEIRYAPLTPRRVTAAIGIPSSYLVQVWRQLNPTPPGEEPKTPGESDLKLIEERETKKIQEQVAVLLPPADIAVPNPLEQVKVTTFTSLPQAEIPEPTVAETAMVWAGDHWSTLGTGLLGLVGLIMLRSMVRGIPASKEPELASTLTLLKSEAETQAEKPTTEQKTAVAARLRRRDRTGPTMRDELVEIVREDPDAAANVLRNWITANS
ncbi:MAG: hypothetical protein SGJ20_18625 [Planctomycetota bacterium]|nr:hypothetical protein [Planctomycetota bacterium]